MQCLVAPAASIAQALRGLWGFLRHLVVRDVSKLEDVPVEVAPPLSLHPLQERIHVERYRDLALAMASHVCHLEGADEAEFIFASIVVLLRSLPHLLTEDQISEAPTSLAGRMAAAATASSLLKFYSDCGYDSEFSAAVLATALTTDERTRYTPDELMESLHSCEATVAWRAGLFSVTTGNVFVEARDNVVEALDLGVIDRTTAKACMAVSFYLAFHSFYDIHCLGQTLSMSTLAAAISLAAATCARESGHAARMQFPNPNYFLVGSAATILERVAALGPGAQTLVGGVFADAQKTEYFMTLNSCVEGAARALRRELV